MINFNKIALSLFLIIGYSFGLICSDEEDKEVAKINGTAIFQSVSPSATWDRCTPPLKSCLRKSSKYGDRFSEEKHGFTLSSRYFSNNIATNNRYKNGMFTSRSVDAIEYVQSKNRGKLNSVGLRRMKKTVTQKQHNDMLDNLSPENIDYVLELLNSRKMEISRAGTSQK